MFSPKKIFTSSHILQLPKENVYINIILSHNFKNLVHFEECYIISENFTIYLIKNVFYIH